METHQMKCEKCGQVMQSETTSLAEWDSPLDHSRLVIGEPCYRCAKVISAPLSHFCDLKKKPSAAAATTPECQQTINHMSRQAELLDEEGNDVSASVMRTAMKALVAEHQRANLLEKERDQQTRFTAPGLFFCPMYAADSGSSKEKS